MAIFGEDIEKSEFWYPLGRTVKLCHAMPAQYGDSLKLKTKPKTKATV